MALQKDYQNWQCLTRLSKGKKDIFKKAYERLLWTTIHQKIGQPTRNGKKSLEIYKLPKLNQVEVENQKRAITI